MISYQRVEVNMNTVITQQLHLKSLVLNIIGFVFLLFTDHSSGASVEKNDDLFHLSLQELSQIKITTVSGFDESLLTAAGAAIVITDDDIRLRGYRSLVDVLQSLPGFNVTKGVYQESYSAFSLRGVYGKNKFIILQNGIRMHDRTGRFQTIDTGISLYSVKQIEVSYGPASALYGADAMTGVINIKTYDNAQQTENKLTIRQGQNNHRYGDFYVSGEITSDISYSIGGHVDKNDHQALQETYTDYYQASDLVTFSGTVIVPANERKQMGFFETESNSFMFDLKFDENFKVGFHHRLEKQSSHYGTSPNEENYDDEAFWLLDNQDVYLIWNQAINKQLDSAIELSYGRYEVSPGSGFSNIYNDFSKKYKYEKGTEFELKHKLDYRLNNKNVFSLGYIYEKFSMIPKTSDLPMKFEPDNSINSQRLTYPGTDLLIKIYDIDYHNKGVFFQWQNQLNDKFITTLGVRYDENSEYGSTINPRLSFVYSQSKDIVWKFLYGQAFLAPSPARRFEHYGSFAYKRDDGIYQSFFMNIPNEELSPEELESFSIVATFILSPTLNLNATAYQQSLSNLISVGPSTPQQPDFITGGNIAYTQSNNNLGKIENQGLDITLRQRINFDVISTDFWLNYSYVDGELGDDNRLPFTSKHMAKAGTTFLLSNWSITPSFNYRSKVNAGPKQDFASKNIVLFNLFSRYEVPHTSFAFDLKIKNLFDKKYLAMRFDPNGIPQETRTIELSISYDF